jgi:hypothetical protein
MGMMSENADGANGATERPVDVSERSDNSRLWNPWSFWKKGRDWHQLFYDEVVSSASNRAVKHVFSNPEEISPMGDGY